MLHRDPDLGGRLPAQEIERDVARTREVVRRLAVANPCSSRRGWQCRLRTDPSNALIQLILARETAPQESRSEDEQPITLIALLPTTHESWPRLVLTEEGSCSE